MHTIELENIATVFVSEFVKQNKALLIPEKRVFSNKRGYLNKPVTETPFLKMPFARRKKLVTATIDSIMNHAKKA